jgi:NTP pyrophosphatase (non-canonical NTP hydrolase)
MGYGTSMSYLKPQASLANLQAYCAEHYSERGFETTPVQECLLLSEEVGELAKAIRKDKAVSGMTIDDNSHVGDVAHELADILWVVSAIANMYEVDLEQAFKEKEAINHGRTWS